MPNATRPTASREDALARLYALWVISTVLIVLGLTVLVLIGLARLDAHAQRTDEQNRRLAKLERSVLTLESERLDQPVEPEAVGPPPGRATSRPATAVERPAERPAATTQRTDPRRPGVPLDDARLWQQLGKLLPPEGATPGELADPAAADRLLDAALEQAGSADWRGRSLTGLALLAHLRNRNDDAARLLQHAADVGDSGAAFYRAAGRRLLALHRDVEAAALAERWRAADRTDPGACLLLAQAAIAGGNYPAAHAALACAATADSPLDVADQLRLGRVYVALEDWPALGALLDTVDPPTPESQAERDFQRAIWLSHHGQFAQALSILDYLIAARPDNSEAHLWRGAVLLNAGQLDAANEALQRVLTGQPRNPAAHYWAGMLEIRRANAEGARNHLNRAIELAPRFAAAWEALGIVELNAEDPAAAAERLAQGVELQPRRSTAQLLLALAEAKRGRRDAALAALKAALEFDPDLLESALTAEALVQLLGTDEIRNLAGASSPPTSTAPTPPAAPVRTPDDE